MAVPFVEQPTPEIAPDRKRWTWREFERLLASGSLTGRHELIDGEIIRKMGQAMPHAVAVMLITQWLLTVFGSNRVLCQASIWVRPRDRVRNAPQPDAVALAERLETYADLPGPDDVLLIAEVSDTTLRFDLSVKADLYARSGFREYWVLDIAGRRLLVHRESNGRKYTRVTQYGEGESVAPVSRPEAAIQVAALLPPTRTGEAHT